MSVCPLLRIVTQSLLLHKTFISRFIDAPKEIINTHCGAQLITDTTSYFHLISLWAPYSHVISGRKSSKHETTIKQLQVTQVKMMLKLKHLVTVSGNQLGSPKQLTWLVVTIATVLVTITTVLVTIATALETIATNIAPAKICSFSAKFTTYQKI